MTSSWSTITGIVLKGYSTASMEKKKSILPQGTYKVIGHTKSRKSKDIILKYFLKTDSITSHFTKLLDENDLPHIKFHALRHSCISLLANNTAFSMKQIQDYAGHSDFLTTFNVYSHTDISAKKSEMDYITSCFVDLFGSNDDE